MVDGSYSLPSTFHFPLSTFHYPLTTKEVFGMVKITLIEDYYKLYGMTLEDLRLLDELERRREQNDNKIK